MPEFDDAIAMVLTTTSTLDEAELIGKMLVEERLAACVQISGPITSVYRWEGAIETATEFRLVAKTRVACWPKLKQRLSEVHSYDEPQVILVRIDAAAEGYAKWLLDETSSI